MTEALPSLYTGHKLWNKQLKQFKLFIRKADLSTILDTDLCKKSKICTS